MKLFLNIIIMLFWASNTFSQMPEIQVKDLEQNLISLNELQGEKLTVIDFWATWCKPCVSAIPKLNSVYNEFSGKGVEFIGINVDGPRNQAKVKPFVKSLNIGYPIVLDPDQQLVEEFNVNVFPTLIILNGNGKEIYVHEGFSTGDEELIKNQLEKLLKK